MSKKLFSKDFTLVVLGQIISLFGNGILRFALPLYLLNQTGSAGIFGAVTALSFLPMILLTPIGGIVADRVNKRNVMVGLDFITALLMLVFLLLLGKVSEIPLLIVTLMFLYGIQGAYQPTVQASMPLMHTKENLLSANAIINQVGSLAGLLAPIIGGILFGLWGLKPIVFISGICFFLSAVMEIFIHIPYKKIQAEQGVLSIVREDLRESFTFMRKERPIILKSIWVICGFNLFFSAMLMVSLPVLLTQTLGISNQLYGYSQGALAAGGLFGGLLLVFLSKKLSIKKVHLLLLITAVLLLPIIAVLWLGLPPFICYITISVSCFLMMSIATMVSVQMLTFIQGETPSHLTGKVMSCVMALSMCSQPLGQAIYGLLFESFKSTPHLIVLATAIISGIIAVLARKVFSQVKCA